jgi:hypothetical protein
MANGEEQSWLDWLRGQVAQSGQALAQLPADASRRLGPRAREELGAPPPPPGPATLRAPTLRERVSDRLRDVYELLAGQPAGQVSDLLGSNFGGAAREFTEGPPAVTEGAISARNKRFVESGRSFLAGHPGPVSREVLADILSTVPAREAHRITKDLPHVPSPLGTIDEILRPAPPPGMARTSSGFYVPGRYVLTPEAEARVTDLTARLGGALPRTGTWSGSRDEEMLNAFGGHTAASDTFGDIFAALSTGTSVPKNAQEAIKVWYDVLEHPDRPFTDARMHELGVGNVRSKTDNVNRALGLYDYVRLKRDLGGGVNLLHDLSGPKVELFSDFQAGRTALPVPDRHYLRGIGSQYDMLDKLFPELGAMVERYEGIPPPKRGGQLQPRDYVRRLNEPVADALRRADPAMAQRMGPLFGKFWDASRAYQGQMFQGGPVDIYRPRGLMEPGAMLDPAALLRALADTRSWTAHALGAALATGLGAEALGGAPPAPPPRLPEEGY